MPVEHNTMPPLDPQPNGEGPSSVPAPPPKPGMSPRATLAILGVVLLFVLMPYLFWQASWFGRPLTDQQLSRYLGDTGHPRNAQHGLVQLSERMDRREPGVSRWYPQVIALTRSPETQVRITAAWVMGRDNSAQEFHKTLVALLADADPMVRSNAALSLVRFGDVAGRPQIRAMLEPAVITAPRAGALNIRLKVTDVVRPGTLVARIVVPDGGSDGKSKKGSASGEKVEVRSAVPGRLERWLAADGAAVVEGQPLLELSPSPEIAWEALRALYLIGQPEDLAVVQNFTRASGDMPPGIQQQAALTLAAIRSRSGS